MTGRNDPCPCGSGKKFKKCHGVEVPAPVARGDARANALKAADVELRDRMLRFARRQLGPDWLTAAFAAYLESDEDAVDELDPQQAQLAVPWALHFLRSTADGSTVAAAFREAEWGGERLSGDMRLLLDAYDRSWLSIWEVQEVERGAGSRVVDQLTGTECFIQDVSSSQTLQRFDAVLGIVLDVEGTAFFAGVHGQPLPPRDANVVVVEARRRCRVRTRPVRPEVLRDLERQLDLIALWDYQVFQMRNQPPPVMHNTDGDPFLQTTDDFALLGSSDDVAGRIATMTGVQTPPDRDGDAFVFTVTKPGNAVNREWNNTVIGRLTLARSHLRVETNSVKRADALRGALEAHLDGQIRFRLRSEANTADLLAHAHPHTHAHAHARAAMPPEAVAYMREFRERHMTAWLDDSIPALGGKTPREAARTPRGRAELEVLIKDMERSEERLPPAERVDIRRLRAELGLR